MHKFQKGVISFGFTFIGLAMLITILNNPMITGFSIYQESCGSSISSEGVWELNSSLSCATGNGIAISVSNVFLDCNSNTLKGGLDENSIGLQISADLINVSIQNCDISSFYNPIVVNSNSNLSIKNSKVTANNTCVTGDWTDQGGNSGCLVESEEEEGEAGEDTTPPIISIVHQKMYTNESLSYEINASDNIAISNYSIDDTTNFAVDSTGILTNIIKLSDQLYRVNITVTDTSSNSVTANLNIDVSLPPTPENDNDESSDNDNSNDNNDDTSSSGGGSSGSPSNSKNKKVCSEDEAYLCTDWKECSNGKQTRTCSKKDDICITPFPKTIRDCVIVDIPEVVEDLQPETIEESKEESTSEESETQRNVLLTGGAITALEKLKELKNPIQFIKSNLVITIVISALMIGFILTLTLNKRAKIKAKKRPLVNMENMNKGKDDTKKLWKWEDEH